MGRSPKTNKEVFRIKKEMLALALSGALVMSAFSSAASAADLPSNGLPQADCRAVVGIKRESTNEKAYDKTPEGEQESETDSVFEYKEPCLNLQLAVAQTQLGNVGGEPYWSWWGYHDRVEWCAIFVSWVADQCGYLDAGVLPRMEGVLPYIDWFKARGQWKGRDFAPSPGDIIFFDWEGDGLADHVGIVEKMENGFIYTIEGSSGDVCAERRYTFGSVPIFGYGLPQFG
ncbi:MAG: CHAP domain-containing protein [Oscillospiraceae bacterium]|nr:CHAP domain-containing protein [Oscillospiraceae bacterium]